VTGVNEQVCFATFVLERPSPGRRSRPEVVLDLPLGWPEGLEPAVHLRDATALAELLGEVGKGVS
jgi:hypothetical protein